jgi:hypothetical protein
MQSLRRLLRALPHHLDGQNKERREMSLSSHNQTHKEGDTERARLTTRSSRRFRPIIVQLDIRVRQRLVETLHHGLDRDLREHVGEDVAVAISTDCCHRPCSSTMNPELSCEALPRMASWRSSGRRNLTEMLMVSIWVLMQEIWGRTVGIEGSAGGLRRVHMSGLKPWAVEMLRTRSLKRRKI